MKKNKLVKWLYICSTIAFYMYLLFSASLLIADIFIEPSDSLSLAPHHKSGYTVPVKLQIHKSDISSLRFTKKDSSQYGDVSSVDKKLYDSILNSSSYEKKIAKYYSEVYNHSKSLDTVNSNYTAYKILHSSGTLLLNPKDIKHKIILALRNYLLMISIIYIIWLIRSFFRSLNNNFNFRHSINRKLKIIGIAILGYQLINTIICFFICYEVFSQVKIIQSTTDTPRTIICTIFPSIEFNIGLITLGLSLVVLSKLISYGQELQEENDLTV